MNSTLSKYFLYYPSTLLRGELVARHLKEAREFQYYDREVVERYQLQRLRELISHAYQNSAYYREKYDKAGILPKSLASLDEFKQFPFFTKQDLASKQDQVCTSNQSLLSSSKTTGGSTGQPVTLIKNSKGLSRERAATWRAYEWAGINVGAPQARFWGEPLFSKDRLKARVTDFIANRIRLSAFELNRPRMQEYLRRIIKFRPHYLYGYVSAIVMFVGYLRDNGLELPESVKAVITTSEVLTETDRELIEETLGIKVFNEYGCGEVGSVAHECEHGNMHLMEDNLYVEIDSDPSGSGEIIVTDFNNYVTPLIRYRVGDIASLGVGNCPCGIQLKTIGNIHGRAYDRILKADGSFCHPELIMYVFEYLKSKSSEIKQFQVVQQTRNLIIVNLVADKRCSIEIERFIEIELKKWLGDKFRIRFEYVAQIERERSGKMRLIKSMV